MTQEERKKIVAEELKKLLEEWRKKSDDVLRRRELPIEDEDYADEDDEEWACGNFYAIKKVLEFF